MAPAVHDRADGNYSHTWDSGAVDEFQDVPPGGTALRGGVLFVRGHGDKPKPAAKPLPMLPMITTTGSGGDLVARAMAQADADSRKLVPIRRASASHDGGARSRQLARTVLDQTTAGQQLLALRRGETRAKLARAIVPVLGLR